MTDSQPEENQVPTSEATPIGNSVSGNNTNNVSDRVGDVMGKVNDTLGKVDWSQMGKYGKAVGIIAIVIVVFCCSSLILLFTSSSSSFCIT